MRIIVKKGSYETLPKNHIYAINNPTMLYNPSMTNVEVNTLIIDHDHTSLVFFMREKEG